MKKYHFKLIITDIENDEFISMSEFYTGSIDKIIRWLGYAIETFIKLKAKNAKTILKQSRL